MSDCTHGGRDVYEPTCRIEIKFVGQERLWMYPLALNGREIQAVTIRGVEYSPSKTCHDENNGEFNGFTCSECGEWCCYDEPFFCPNYGAANEACM